MSSEDKPELSEALKAAHKARAEKLEQKRLTVAQQAEELLAKPTLNEEFRLKLAYAHKHASTNSLMYEVRGQLIQQATRGV